MTVTGRFSNSSRSSLPGTMAGLLESAIEHARLLDRSIYFPRSDKWHNADNPPRCEIGLAGCLVAGKLEVPPGKTISSFSFPHDTESKLDALNCMRLGYWLKAFELIYQRPPSSAVRESLNAMPNPLCSKFYGWGEFDGHLDSLERLLPALHSIDRDAASA